MKILDKLFLASILSFSLYGFNNIVSWGRSPAVQPILEIPHDFPQNVSQGNLGGYNLSHKKLKATLSSDDSKIYVPTIKGLDLLTITASLFALFGPIGFFYLGNLKDKERELTNYYPLPKSKKNQNENNESIKKAS